MSEQKNTSQRLAVEKRPLTPCLENSKMCKKVKSEVAEIESPNTDHLGFGNKVKELFEQMTTADMEQFKGTMEPFCEITTNLLTMVRKNAELYGDINEAKRNLAAANKRAEKAEETLEDWKKAYKDLFEKAEESRKRAEKAEKAVKDMMTAFKAIATGFGGIGKAFQDLENVVACNTQKFQ